MGNYTIKEAKVEDSEKAADLVWEVFLEFEAPVYSDEGTEHFKEGLNYNTMRERLVNDKNKMWLCFDKDTIVGVIRVRPPCHINLLFVKKEYHRKGIARALYNEAAKHYKAIGSNIEITVNSSPYAVEAYRKLGFAETKPEQVVNGLRFTPMKRIL